MQTRCTPYTFSVAGYINVSCEHFEFYQQQQQQNMCLCLKYSPVGATVQFL